MAILLNLQTTKTEQWLIMSGIDGIHRFEYLKKNNNNIASQKEESLFDKDMRKASSSKKKVSTSSNKGKKIKKNHKKKKDIKEHSKKNDHDEHLKLKDKDPVDEKNNLHDDQLQKNNVFDKKKLTKDSSEKDSDDQSTKDESDDKKLDNKELDPKKIDVAGQQKISKVKDNVEVNSSGKTSNENMHVDVQSKIKDMKKVIATHAKSLLSSVDGKSIKVKMGSNISELKDATLVLKKEDGVINVQLEGVSSENLALARDLFKQSINPIKDSMKAEALNLGMVKIGNEEIQNPTTASTQSDQGKKRDDNQEKDSKDRQNSKDNNKQKE